MSRDTAMAEAQKLKAILERHGVRVSIELMEGRPWSGDSWYSPKHVLMNHHTAGSNTGDTPSLALVKRGRGADLPGPLCNGYGGRDLVFRIITMGLANHPGAGGPLTVAGFTLPKDSARISSFGIEWEHDGVSDWPADMREFMGRVGAGVLEYMAASVGRSIEHKTWAPGRKVDRNDFTAATGQALITKWAGAGQEEDDMDWTEKHKYTAKDAELLADPKKEGVEYSASEMFRGYSPGMQRLRREALAFQRATTATLAGLKAAVEAQGAALKAVAAGNPEDIRKALADFEAGLAAKLADIDVRVSFDTDDAPRSER